MVDAVEDGGAAGGGGGVGAGGEACDASLTGHAVSHGMEDGAGPHATAPSFALVTDAAAQSSDPNASGTEKGDEKVVGGGMEKGDEEVEGGRAGTPEKGKEEVGEGGGKHAGGYDDEMLEVEKVAAVQDDDVVQEGDMVHDDGSNDVGGSGPKPYTLNPKS